MYCIIYSSMYSIIKSLSIIWSKIYIYIPPTISISNTTSPSASLPGLFLAPSTDIATTFGFVVKPRYDQYVSRSDTLNLPPNSIMAILALFPLFVFFGNSYISATWTGVYEYFFANNEYGFNVCGFIIFPSSLYVWKFVLDCNLFLSQITLTSLCSLDFFPKTLNDFEPLLLHNSLQHVHVVTFIYHLSYISIQTSINQNIHINH